jgi:hypothetical protein
MTATGNHGINQSPTRVNRVKWRKQNTQRSGKMTRAAPEATTSDGIATGGGARESPGGGVGKRVAGDNDIAAIHAFTQV